MTGILPRMTILAADRMLDAPGSSAAMSESRSSAWRMASSVERTDSSDVAAALSGDGDAYARLIERHQGRIAGLMWRFTRDKGELEELVQDAFVEAYTSLGSFKRGRPFYPWLRKIAVRVGYRHWRRRPRARREVSLNEMGELAARPEEVEPGRAAELVHGLLARLRPRDRLILTLLYLEECSVAEAAELTGWSRIMVKVQAHRARNRLRKLVETEKKG